MVTSQPILKEILFKHLSEHVFIEDEIRGAQSIVKVMILGRFFRWIYENAEKSHEEKLDILIKKICEVLWIEIRDMQLKSHESNTDISLEI